MVSNARVHRLSIATIIVLATLLVVGRASAQLNQTRHNDGWILAAVHAPGYNGSIWRTDLWIVLARSEENTSMTLYFNRSGRDNGDVHGIQVDLVEGQEVYYFEDVVDEFLHIGGGSWLGAIHYMCNENVQVWARVYSISPDGRASYGQMIEGIPTADASPDSDPWDADTQQWLYAMKHTADGRYRVNIGVVNPSNVAATYSLVIYDRTGNNSDGNVSVEVPPFSMVQLSDPFAGAYGGDWDDVVIRIRTITENASTFAYASVVDNATNDAFFVRGVKRMTPDE